MNFFIKFLILSLFVICAKCQSEKPILIVSSFDGFRFDYMSKAKTPNLDSIKSNGASVKYMLSSFLTRTFPNHQSIATGLYAENHGVIDSTVFDPKYNRYLGVGDEKFYHYDDNVKPIWIRNKNSGTIMWAGGAFGYGSRYEKSMKNVNFTKSRTDEWKVDEAIKWVIDTKNPINLVMIYFGGPDSMGHAYGPDSSRVVARIEESDKIVGYMVSKLKEKGIFSKTNLIFLSDHGMEKVKSDGKIDLTNQILNPSIYKYKSYGRTPLIQIQPDNKNDVEKYYRVLREAARIRGNEYMVYRKEDIPKKWHFANNRRVFDIVVVADPGYWFNGFGSDMGVHGYDNDSHNMSAFFVAHGPAFKKRYEGRPFKNIDVVPLMCSVLKIPIPTTNEIDGNFDNVKDLLA